MFTYVVLLLAALLVANGQHHWVHQCPVCSDPYDHTTCTHVQNCHNTHEICLFKLDLGLNNRVNYYCTNYHQCETYASFPCDFSAKEDCYFCCLDVPSCNQQREALFMGIIHG
ncbi:uncharacterized protein LOC106067380 [Biomphalaria glabrata]|uniref:Uncharacterized protein LOC106067380 n=1 Tax=Biomphalaria glabrata TaxID=6526 RepID=A0A9W3ATX0_BIOGL|nr:uncharacterized protein LOC106067380 [Biomphalaria glabrata]